MIQGSQYHIVPNKGSVPDENASLVLKLAPHVEEYPFTHMDVLAAVGVEGGKEGEAVVHRSADELGKELPHLLRGMVAAVQPGGKRQSLLAHSVHELVHLASPCHRFAAVKRIQKSL